MRRHCRNDETPFIATMFENVGKVTIALEEHKEYNKQLSVGMDQQEEFYREMLEAGATTTIH